MLKFHRDLSHVQQYFTHLHSVHTTYIDRSVNNTASDMQLLQMAQKLYVIDTANSKNPAVSLNSSLDLLDMNREQLLDYIDSQVNHAYYIHNIEIYLM